MLPTANHAIGATSTSVARLLSLGQLLSNTISPKPLGRIFMCAWCNCQVVVCKGCYSGHRYCSKTCFDASRKESARIYWGSRKGKRLTAARVHAWRNKAKLCVKIVTGSLVTQAPAAGILGFDGTPAEESSDLETTKAHGDESKETGSVDGSSTPDLAQQTSASETPRHAADEQAGKPNSRCVSGDCSRNHGASSPDNAPPNPDPRGEMRCFVCLAPIMRAVPANEPSPAPKREVRNVRHRRARPRFTPPIRGHDSIRA
jgi:hypothetical protein